MYFRRHKSEVENVRAIAETLPEEQKEQVLNLVKSYENATFVDSTDKRNFDFDAIDTAINDFGFDEKKLAERLANNHNTLQQTFMRLCLRFIEQMAQKPYWDGRNEASVQTAKKIVEAIGENTRLPMI